ncbi:MAG: hypothetical protein J1F63_10300, partial [Oscillospiraceae bacterium]|nr:hypothetical protein [Oscillospiraceae bacterium]
MKGKVNDFLPLKSAFTNFFKIFLKKLKKGLDFLFWVCYNSFRQVKNRYSSIAQSVEHAAVNRRVV